MSKKELSGYDISCILRKNPEQVDKVDIGKMDAKDISRVLYKQPGLVDKLDLAKMNGDNIRLVLTRHPGLIDKLDLSKMSGYDIRWVLSKQPELVDKFDLDKMDGDAITWVLRRQPGLVDKLEISKIRGEKGSMKYLDFIGGNGDIGKELTKGVGVVPGKEAPLGTSGLPYSPIPSLSSYAHGSFYRIIGPQIKCVPIQYVLSRIKETNTIDYHPHEIINRMLVGNKYVLPHATYVFMEHEKC